MLGLLCVEWNGAGSNLALHLNSFPCRIISKFRQFVFVLDHICAMSLPHAGTMLSDCCTARQG